MNENTRFQILHRDNWSCQRCGKPIKITDYSIHHRRSRGMGGSKNADQPSNLVTLCGSGTTGCHGEIESRRSDAYESGWLVHRNSQDLTEEIPLTDLQGRTFGLTDDFTVIPIREGISA